MTDIHIPPAALQAGARAQAAADGYGWVYMRKADQRTYLKNARAAFLAMIAAWPGMREQKQGPFGITYEIILPLTEKPDDKA